MLNPSAEHFTSHVRPADRGYDPRSEYLSFPTGPCAWCDLERGWRALQWATAAEQSDHCL